MYRRILRSLPIMGIGIAAAIAIMVPAAAGAATTGQGRAARLQVLLRPRLRPCLANRQHTALSR